MTRNASREIADHYLARVDAAAEHAGLPTARRTELRRELRATLDDAAAHATTDAASAMLDAIHELGEPQAVAAAAFRAMPDPVYPAPPSRSPYRGRAELTAVILVAIGWPLAGLGTIAGVFLLLTSEAWTRNEKLTGFAFAVLPFLTLSVGFSTGSHVSVLTNIGFAVGFLSPIIAAVVLWRRAGRRQMPAKPAATRPPGERKAV